MGTYETLLDNRSDPGTREILGDFEMSHGHRPYRTGIALWIMDAKEDVDAADAEAVDTADATDTDDTDDAADAASDATDDSEAAGAEAPEAVAAEDAATNRGLTNLLIGDIDVTNGLKVIQVPGRWGYSVTRVGWLRRVSGDEWELLPGSRTIVRTGQLRTLDSLASQGPGEDHRLSDPSGGTEEIHRLIIRRSLPADEAAWMAHCPRPASWE